MKYRENWIKLKLVNKEIKSKIVFKFFQFLDSLLEKSELFLFLIVFFPIVYFFSEILYRLRFKITREKDRSLLLKSSKAFFGDRSSSDILYSLQTNNGESTITFIANQDLIFLSVDDAIESQNCARGIKEVLGEVKVYDKVIQDLEEIKAILNNPLSRFMLQLSGAIRDFIIQQRILENVIKILLLDDFSGLLFWYCKYRSIKVR